MSIPSTLPEPSHTPLRGGPVVRWGVLAPGGIAHDWVTTLHANTGQRVVAVASRSRDRAEAFALRHGIPRAHGEIDALLADAEVDVVYIASPHPFHAELALRAIAAGKHVLVEKPIATTAEDAERIAVAARAAGVFAMEAMWTRFLPQSTVIRRLLDDGALGRLRFASADFGGRMPFDPSSRAFDPALGGGALLDLGVYSLWFTTWALGMPGSASAAGSLAETGVDEQATVLLELPGAIGVASASMVAQTPTTALVVGEEARIEVDAPFCAPGGFAVRAGDEVVRWEDPTALRWRDGLCYQATAVAAHVAAGRTEAPEHPLDASIGVLRLIDAARASLGAA